MSRSPLTTPILVAIAVVHGFVWSLLATVLTGSVRVDVAEGAIRGPEWQLSYIQHPPLPTWLTGFISVHGGSWRYFAVYATGQALAIAALGIVSAFIARREGKAVGGLVLLIGLTSPALAYFPLHLNHNMGVMPFYALTIWAGWYAFERGRLLDWILFGAAVGGGLWAKYSILHLVLPLGILFLTTAQWRQQLLSAKPWAAAAIAGLIIAPHLVDSFNKGGVTLTHAIKTSGTAWTEHLMYFGQVLLNFLAYAVVASIVPTFLIGARALLSREYASFKWASLSRFDRYILVAAFGPVAVITFAGLIFGVTPKYHWYTVSIPGLACWFARLVGPSDAAVPRASDIAANSHGCKSCPGGCGRWARFVSRESCARSILPR